MRRIKEVRKQRAGQAGGGMEGRAAAGGTGEGWGRDGSVEEGTRWGGGPSGYQ